MNFHVMTTEHPLVFVDAQKIAKELFEKFPGIDGVIASNDLGAAAVLHEALRIGKSIRDDLQIIGYDDIPLSKLTFSTAFYY